MTHVPPVSVLLVDDQPRNVLALQVALAGVDCTLVTAGSGRQALRCVLDQDFAVILLDVRMPVLDGFETASLIRARQRSQSTPIIFLTAYDADGTHVREGYRFGAIDYLYKPLDTEILRSKVTLFVELFRQNVALERAEQQVRELNAELEARVLDRTAALEAANIELEAAALERLRTEQLLRALEYTARTEAELAAERASVLAEASRGLVEDFRDLNRMLERVAHIAAIATDSACVIQLVDQQGDDVGLMPHAIDHPDQAVREELARVSIGPQHMTDFPWHGLHPVFLDLHPLIDAHAVPMLARTETIGVFSLVRLGSEARQFNVGEQKFADDVAARVALAVESGRLYQSARDAIAQRDNFLTIAAHELKTPLTAIQGYSQLLSHQIEQGSALVDAPVRRSASMIEDRCRHLAKLVEQILDVSRLVSSRMPLNRDETDLVVMIRDLLTVFESRDPARVFHLRSGEAHLKASVDAIRLEQVLANLIDNAVRYSPHGTPIEITIDQFQDERVVLSVRDWGLGIPEEYRDHIFERFHQAHADSYRSGMGLGLHISREIVLLHGGNISVSFPADGGSQFTIQLPRRFEALAA